MKKYLILSLWLIAFGGLFFANNAHAAIEIISAEITPTVIKSGQPVEATVTVQRTGGACNNNWVSTKIIVAGVETSFNHPQIYTQGTSTDVEKFIFNSPVSEGIHDVLIEAWLGDEEPSLGCSESLGDDYSLNSALTVDDTPPVITLLGDEVVDLFVGDFYQDAGATADDNVDGDLTNEIIVYDKAIASINNGLLGSYVITYEISDMAGNKTEITRTVNVNNRPISSGGGTGYLPGYGPQILPDQEVIIIAGEDGQVLGASTSRDEELERRINVLRKRANRIKLQMYYLQNPNELPAPALVIPTSDGVGTEAEAIAPTSTATSGLPGFPLPGAPTKPFWKFW